MKNVVIAGAIGALTGYAAAQPYFSDFEADNGGLAATGDWQWGSPTGFAGAPFGGPEPIGGFSGNNAWGTIIGGAHNPGVISTLTLSGIDFDAAVEVSFYEWIDSGSNAFDMAKVFVGGTEISLSDGGPTNAWRFVSLDVSGFSGTQDLTFEFSATTVVERVGWYIDDLSVRVPTPASAALLGLGGLVAVRRRR